MDSDTRILSRLYLFAGAGLLAVALVGSAPALAQTANTLFNLNSSITKPQPVVTTSCATTPVVVACPSDTKTQLHYLPSGASTVYLGLDGTISSTTGLPLAAGGKQAWDVAGSIVRCVTSSGTQTLYTLCGRGN